MSEYQYYEFQAIDRPLTNEEMTELRAISSRAEITPTRFTNFYSYGSFKGDEIEFLERFFDAHVYVANWGSHVLSFGVPLRAVDLDALQAYQRELGFAVLTRGERAILTFESQDEEGGGWVDDDEGAGWMGSLISLRADIMAGDLRAAYLGWLRGLQAEGFPYEEDEGEGSDDGVVAALEVDEEDEDDVEPPVPPGLGSLTGPLKSLVEFLELDQDLVAVAAEASEPMISASPSTGALRQWVGGLSPAEKDSILLRLMQGDTQLQPELRRRFSQATAPGVESASAKRRTTRDLLVASASRAAEREAREKEAAAKERARRAEEAARARDAHLRSMIGHESALWRQVEDHIGRKQPKEYDRAVAILADLRDLAAREAKGAEFSARIGELRDRHASKPSFMERLDKAGLR